MRPLLSETSFVIVTDLPELNLSYLQKMPIYYPSGKYKLSNCFFLDYSYIILFVHGISRPSQKYVWFGAWHKQRAQFFSAMNLTMFIKLFTSMTFSASFLTYILFLRSFSFKYSTIIGCILKLDGTLTATWWNIDLVSVQKWHSFPNSSIFYTFVVICYIISTFKTK